ncbi:DUF389 domain-containing protein [Spongisporangium articulatum]|uniref:DUF389 domain-containing protein n=1 Tax=Spongisporangium articulatum TaxID=3362603 RepID=A0ABW8APV8_9ACTN
MIDLRIVVPGPMPPAVLDLLEAEPRVAHVVLLTGTSFCGPGLDRGDTLICLVAREAASDVIAQVRAAGLHTEAGIVIEEVEAVDSPAAARAERAAPGAPEDGIVWDVVRRRAADDARLSWSYFAFLTLATAIAAVAVITDSPILIVGAMVVGPEFGPVSAIAVGLVLRRRHLLAGAGQLLLIGFAVAILLVAVLAVLARAADWVSAADVLAPRPQTGFVWRPDRWSVVVALLAGAAGVLSLTAGRGNALVGVFISVTTVPAAGNLALALAFVDQPRMVAEIGGAATQLGVNLLGMVVAGAVVLAVQRVLTDPRFRPARNPRR